MVAYLADGALAESAQTLGMSVEQAADAMASVGTSRFASEVRLAMQQIRAREAVSRG